MDDPTLRQWLATLDSMSYYELFRAPTSATHDDLRVAFHAFAEAFHPDVHRWRPPEEQAAIGRIYRRGTEAWRILSDPTLRARYDEALADGVVRPEHLLFALDGPRSLAPPAGGGRLVDTVRSPAARPFLLRAEELLKHGDPKQAKLQLVMAMHLDKGNAALEAFDERLDEAISTRQGDDEKRQK